MMSDPRGPARADGTGSGPADGDRLRRRTVLGLSALTLTAALAGCRGGGSADGTGTPSCRERAPEDLSGPVPEEYRTAKAQVNEYTRNPDELLSKEQAGYQREPKFENACRDCGKFVPDENGDCLGACVRVEGYVEPWGWCEQFSDASGVSW